MATAHASAPNLWSQAVSATLHCLTGCAIGEVLGLILATRWGWSTGPGIALAVVSGSPAPELRKAIALGDHARFQAIPGIGKKTAERIVLELKEKIGDAPVPISSAGGTQPHLVARDALVELGYSLGEAELALARVDPELSPEERVREALRAA